MQCGVVFHAGTKCVMQSNILIYVSLNLSWLWPKAHSNYLQCVSQTSAAFSSDFCTVCINNITQHNSVNWEPLVHRCIVLLFGAIKPFSHVMDIYILLCLTSKNVLCLGFNFIFFNQAFKDDTHTFLTNSCAFMYFYFIFRRHVNCAIGNQARIRILQVCSHLS